MVDPAVTPLWSQILGPWGLPREWPARIAIAIAVALFGIALTRAGRGPIPFGWSPRLRVLVAFFVPAFLSLAYVVFYLRGGPRIIDATTYFLQGRALDQGHLAWPLAEPSASYRGRFLVTHDGTLGGLFPPGYPLFLAPGFRLGAPLVMGPVLAGLGALATAWLVHEIVEASGPRAFTRDERDFAVRFAVLVSATSACLRYHTSDTMSHGLVAVLFLVAFAAAARARRRPGPGWPLLCGLAVGWVLATRLASFAPVLVCAVWLLAGASWRSLVPFVAGIAPFAWLLVASQRAVTGDPLASAQRLYYALSDGPAGCFAYGFGKDVGCVVEHGDFVAKRLPHGYGALEALLTTGARLRRHLADVANFEPLFLVWLAGAWRLDGTCAPGARNPIGRAALVLLALQVLAYAPFYFDGNYPGGGGRMFADLLGVEHALFAVGAVLLWRARPLVARGASLLGVSVLAFGLRGVHEHEHLRDRDGGHPMWDPAVLAQAHVERGLVFVSTDHAFASAYAPRQDPKTGIAIVRYRGDGHDRMVYEALGSPPSFKYVFEPGGPTPSGEIVSFVPPPANPLRLEAEAEWPALSQRGGHAWPVWTPETCSGSRALAVHPQQEKAQVTIELPVPAPGAYDVEPVVHHRSGSSGRGELRIEGTVFTWTNDAASTGCVSLGARKVPFATTTARAEIVAEGGEVALDVVLVSR